MFLLDTDYAVLLQRGSSEELRLCWTECRPIPTRIFTIP